jgi:mannonate dehydratase
MLETWRWFGHDDPVTLRNARQAGAAGIVTALHQSNTGGVWPEEDVRRRRDDIAEAGLTWSVVESIGVGEEIKTRTGHYQQKIENYKQSIRNVARAGVKVICYNFMAITDWSRTDLRWQLANGGYALRFDAVDFAAYDLFVLRRRDAEADYAREQLDEARRRFEALSPERLDQLEKNLIDWLPARDVVYDRDGFRRMLDVYKEMSTEDLRANLIAFLRDIAPVADEEGARLCIHPDDPSFPIFGLPRVMSTADDVRALFSAVPSRACGLTLCTGSFGSNPENDLVAMAEEFASRIHFAHLRNTRREPDGSFHEAEHLDGDTDLIAVIAALMSEEDRRAHEGRADAQIPMRADHGHLLADDVNRKVNPGYSNVGRLKGLAELRGVTRAIEAFRSGRIN